MIWHSMIGEKMIEEIHWRILQDFEGHEGLPEGYLVLSLEGDPVQINSKILIRQKDEKYAEYAC